MHAEPATIGKATDACVAVEDTNGAVVENDGESTYDASYDFNDIISDLLCKMLDVLINDIGPCVQLLSLGQEDRISAKEKYDDIGKKTVEDFLDGLIGPPFIPSVALHL